jgi:hypothetical protein
MSIRVILSPPILAGSGSPSACAAQHDVLLPRMFAFLWLPNAMERILAKDMSQSLMELELNTA